jgi:hypothetical protein
LTVRLGREIWLLIKAGSTVELKTVSEIRDAILRLVEIDAVIGKLLMM